MPRASQHREVSKTTQAWGSTRAACHCALWGCGSTRKAPALQAVLCGSITRHLHHFTRELSRLADCKSAVEKPVGRRRVEHYHQFPPLFIHCPRFRSRSRRGARLSTVSLTSASLVETAMAAISISITTSGTRKTANPRGLGPRYTRGGTGVPDHFTSP